VANTLIETHAMQLSSVGGYPKNERGHSALRLGARRWNSYHPISDARPWHRSCALRGSREVIADSIELVFRDSFVLTAVVCRRRLRQTIIPRPAMALAG